eukprot:11655748-Prorocentrum_lima.AAC.1
MPEGEGLANSIEIETTSLGSTQQCDRAEGAFVTQRNACLDFKAPDIQTVAQPPLGSRPTTGGWE